MSGFWGFYVTTGKAIFLKDFVYLFLERGEGREKERQRNIKVWLPLKWGPGPQPRHML